MCDILDCLSEMQASVSADSIAALVYIAGYLTAKSKNKDLDGSHFYYEKYGGCTADLNWGGLHIFRDSVCQWVIYSSVMFHDVVQGLATYGLRARSSPPSKIIRPLTC